MLESKPTEPTEREHRTSERVLRDEVLALREEAKSLKGILNYLAAAWDSAYSYEEMGHPAEEAVRRYRELYADV